MATRQKEKAEKGKAVRSTVNPQILPDVREEEPVERDRAAERRAVLQELTRLSEDAGLYDADYRSLLPKSR